MTVIRPNAKRRAKSQYELFGVLRGEPAALRFSTCVPRSSTSTESGSRISRTCVVPGIGPTIGTTRDYSRHYSTSRALQPLSYKIVVPRPCCISRTRRGPLRLRGRGEPVVPEIKPGREHVFERSLVGMLPFSRTGGRCQIVSVGKQGVLILKLTLSTRRLRNSWSITCRGSKSRISCVDTAPMNRRRSCRLHLKIQVSPNRS